MGEALNYLRLCFDSRRGARSSIAARWIFLRALAGIYFSAFFSLLFQIKGLIGPQGILPAQRYLMAVGQYFGGSRFWHAPSLFWISAGSPMLMAVMWLGVAASLLALCNVWPRLSFFFCFVCFLSFVSAAGDFSNYQSDGMLLEAGCIALFFAPSGIWPGWAADQPPSRASLFLLQWEWFRIYFESGLAKMLSGDAEWRNFTAMDEYYQNSPLPTWIGWYVEHLPHWFHAASALFTLVLELLLVWMFFMPRRVRLICFFIVTPWEIGVILTGNYAFLNYIVLALGFLLLDDADVKRWFGKLVHWKDSAPQTERKSRSRLTTAWRGFGVGFAAIVLSWIGYVTTTEMVLMIAPGAPIPTGPIRWIEPLRVANQYGLFAVMTRGRYEIEFQGSNDGKNWRPYVFRYKPQLLGEAPGIYAPYQPRFDWNLWFASLGDWRQNDIVPFTEGHLLTNDADVLSLFRSNPFAAAPPRYVRAVLWQYWFTSMAEKGKTGNWWRRQYLGQYAPTITRLSNGSYAMTAPADELPRHD